MIFSAKAFKVYVNNFYVLICKFFGITYLKELFIFLIKLLLNVKNRKSFSEIIFYMSNAYIVKYDS